jgi:hypothetical protein
MEMMVFQGGMWLELWTGEGGRRQEGIRESAFPVTVITSQITSLEKIHAEKYELGHTSSVTTRLFLKTPQNHMQ